MSNSSIGCIVFLIVGVVGGSLFGYFLSRYGNDVGAVGGIFWLWGIWMVVGAAIDDQASS